MNKQECRKCQEEIERSGKLCPWRSISGDYCDKVELNEPPQEPCEYCECGINQKYQLFQFLPPEISADKVIGDTITFDKINFCPSCGRRLTEK